VGLERDTALTQNKRIVDDFKKSIKSIGDEAMALGGKLDLKIFDGLIEQLERANTELTDQKYLQGLKDLLPSVDEYNAKITEVSRGKTELTELEKLNAQVNLLQLDILAATNPALAEHVRLLRERAGALDAATAKQKTDNESIGAGIQDRLQEYYNSIKDIGGAIGDAVVGSLKGLEDQLTAFVTTGKASFNDLATSIIEDLSRIVIRAAIIKPITEAIGSLFPGFKFANGGIMTGDGPMPLKKYASGGIANSPQLALYGEGSRPEAFVPLPDGRRIPVAMQGGGGGSTNVTVNVDASGNASVQGDQSQAKQLGVAVSAAVQAELVKQQRPGGILAGTRR
jgi:phage-related minor tail protein